MPKHLKPSERRDAIINVLCDRRQDTISNLAQEFGVSIRTIKYDIEELTLAHPIETKRGKYGGWISYKQKAPETRTDKITSKIANTTYRCRTGDHEQHF